MTAGETLFSGGGNVGTRHDPLVGRLKGDGMSCSRVRRCAISLCVSVWDRSDFVTSSTRGRTHRASGRPVGPARSGRSQRAGGRGSSFFVRREHCRLCGRGVNG